MAQYMSTRAQREKRCAAGAMRDSALQAARRARLLPLPDTTNVYSESFCVMLMSPPHPSALCVDTMPVDFSSFTSFAAALRYADVHILRGAAEVIFAISAALMPSAFKTGVRPPYAARLRHMMRLPTVLVHICHMRIF